MLLLKRRQTHASGSWPFRTRREKDNGRWKHGLVRALSLTRITTTHEASSAGSDHFNPLTPQSRKRTFAFPISGAANQRGSKTPATFLVMLT